MNLSRQLETILATPDISPLLERVDIRLGGDGPDFLVDGCGHVSLPASALAPDSDATVIVRHALELCFQWEILPDDPVLAGLMAARCAALFRTLRFSHGIGLPPAWHGLMVGDTAPGLAELSALWPKLAVHQPGVPQTVAPATGARLAALWPFLGPTEYLIMRGGDTRLQIDPKTGLNTYGCSPRPRPWAITFASSTASSISERGYAAAEQARRRMLGDAVKDGIAFSQAKEAARIRQALRDYYGLPKTVRILIVPSGTDGELLALGIALLGAPSRPLTNLLVGPEESGSGVPLAAAGHHFSTLTARGVAVTKGCVMAGIPADLEVSSVPVRKADGSLRPATEITADCAARTAAAIARGRRVLFHILDQSKTGLLAPHTAGSDWPRDPDWVDVIVDASQARLNASSVRGYGERGAMVLLTGSKFFTGPPFAGALLVPTPIADRLDGRQTWPAGFADYFEDIGSVSGETEPAERTLTGKPFVEEVSLGLALRWQAALAEMAAFAAVDEAVVSRILHDFASRVEVAIKANPDLYWLETAPLERRDFPEGWDHQPTIFTFSVWQPSAQTRPRQLFDVPEAKHIYTWLNSDLSDLLPAGSSQDERRLAGRCAQYWPAGRCGNPIGDDCRGFSSEYGGAPGIGRALPS